MIDLLEGELSHAGRIQEHEPVRVVVRPVRRWFITGSVSQTEQLPVELGELSRSCGVENGVQQLGVLGHDSAP